MTATGRRATFQEDFQSQHRDVQRQGEFDSGILIVTCCVKGHQFMSACSSSTLELLELYFHFVWFAQKCIKYTSADFQPRQAKSPRCRQAEKQKASRILQAKKETALETCWLWPVSSTVSADGVFQNATDDQTNNKNETQ